MSDHANGNGAQDLGGRFPGLDVLGQAGHWDRVTADVILARVGPLPAVKFFTAAEKACAAALLDQLTGQRAEPLVPVLQMIDARLEPGKPTAALYGYARGRPGVAGHAVLSQRGRR